MTGFIVVLRFIKDNGEIERRAYVKNGEPFPTKSNATKKQRWLLQTLKDDLGDATVGRLVRSERLEVSVVPIEVEV